MSEPCTYGIEGGSRGAPEQDRAEMGRSDMRRPRRRWPHTLFGPASSGSVERESNRTSRRLLARMAHHMAFLRPPNCLQNGGRLTRPESTAYDAVATAEPAQFRRIEQEAVPLPQAAVRLEALIGTRSCPRSGAHRSQTRPYRRRYAAIGSRECGGEAAPLLTRECLRVGVEHLHAHVACARLLAAARGRPMGRTSTWIMATCAKFHGMSVGPVQPT